jgi:hypothetical protein
MGCDIHFYVEKWSDEELTEGPIDISDKRDSRISNVLKLKREYRWISVDKWYRDEGYWTNYGNSFYSGRDYNLFAKLADVRNYNNNIKPLDQPRGIPVDASYAYKLMTKEDGDSHSHSYFTLCELLDSGVDWGANFLSTIEKMKRIDPDPSNVRCVFFFDN